MAKRRSLAAGLTAKPQANRADEENFIYDEKPKPVAAPPAPAPMEPTAVRASTKVNRVPFTTRLRADLAEAVKNASLERQLRKIEPNQVQEILESALEPWLRANGYLT
jgi:hypothetical protein